jgi:hypothetical protein
VGGHAHAAATVTLTCLQRTSADRGKHRSVPENIVCGAKSCPRRSPRGLRHPSARGAKPTVTRQDLAAAGTHVRQTEAGVEYHFGAARNPSFAIELTAFCRSGAAPSGCRSRSMLRGSSRCSPDSSKYVCSRSSPTCGSGQRRSRWDHTRTCRQAIAGLGTTRAIASHGHHQDRPAYQHADHRLLLDSG